MKTKMILAGVLAMFAAVAMASDVAPAKAALDKCEMNVLRDPPEIGSDLMCKKERAAFNLGR